MALNDNGFFHVSKVQSRTKISTTTISAENDDYFTPISKENIGCAAIHGVEAYL